MSSDSERSPIIIVVRETGVPGHLQIDVDSGLITALKQISLFQKESPGALVGKALKLLYSDTIVVKVNNNPDVKMKIEVKK